MLEWNTEGIVQMEIFIVQMEIKQRKVIGTEVLWWRLVIEGYRGISSDSENLKSKGIL